MNNKIQNPEKKEVLNPHSQRVAILDFGAQYGKLIDKRIRSLNVESIILPGNTPAEQLKGYSAIVLSGGPSFVNAENAPKYDPKVFELDIPMLGICYGMQLMAHVGGGKVGAGVRREDAQTRIQIQTDSLLFGGLEGDQDVLLTHGDSVLDLPPGYRSIANSEEIVVGMENPELKRYAVQFHPETDLTIKGRDIFSNFLFQISGLTQDYTMENRKEKAIAYIKEKVGNKKVLALVSGGVDSTVCASLLGEAVGSENVIALHVDTGFMRKDESEMVKVALESVGINLNVIDASEEFFTNLQGVAEPEKKRVIIGDTFIKVAKQFLSEQGINLDDIFLAQGTLRPDLIESASIIANSSGSADKIKTHHNDSPLVREMREKGLVVEPLTDYHKDEVRELGESLGLPENIVWRQPFPGPGLAIRMLCADEPFLGEDFDDVQQQLRQFETENIHLHLLPVATVGVQGDGRSYKYLVGLSTIENPNWEEIIELTKKIPQTVKSINRVAYIFGDPIPKSKMLKEITQTALNRQNIEQLRQSDAIVNEILLKYNLIRKLSQVPVISFPVSFDEPGKRSIAIRTIITRDFMTGLPAIPGKDIPEEAVNEIVQRILSEVAGISRVVYDLTSKPPGTIEWE